jgi:hypothetical protein
MEWTSVLSSVEMRTIIRQNRGAKGAMVAALRLLESWFSGITAKKS